MRCLTEHNLMVFKAEVTPFERNKANNNKKVPFLGKSEELGIRFQFESWHLNSYARWFE